jgi:hypothetical protein
LKQENRQVSRWFIWCNSVANLDIAQWCKETNVSLDQGVRAIKIEVFSDVIENTRVRFGRLVGNWQTSTGQPITSTTERLDPSASAVISEMKANVTSYGVDYMTNNLPYAEVWEERDGMVVKALARVESIVRRTKK